MKRRVITLRELSLREAAERAKTARDFVRGVEDQVLRKHGIHITGQTDEEPESKDETEEDAGRSRPRRLGRHR